ncbi:hypothetical protein BD408DRAFT_413732 [Parasitella parasitica]|nr:hypothetical protein BD408DRAFT_413732 [Parasitella parasitica]
MPKKKKKIESLRLLAPKLEAKSCCSKSSTSPSTPTPSTPTTPITAAAAAATAAGKEPVSSCCSSKSSTAIASLPITASEISSSNALTAEPVPIPDIPPPTSCCGPPSKNQQGETIRIVTCRCGDSCACIGCDAHPLRAMKEGKNDVYIGFDSSTSSKRRLSIAAICATAPSSTTSTKTLPQPQLQPQPQPQPQTIMDHPTSILAEDGTVLCGCGCSRAFVDCPGCFSELCDGYDFN